LEGGRAVDLADPYMTLPGAIRAERDPLAVRRERRIPFAPRRAKERRGRRARVASERDAQELWGVDARIERELRSTDGDLLAIGDVTRAGEAERARRRPVEGNTLVRYHQLFSARQPGDRMPSHSFDDGG